MMDLVERIERALAETGMELVKLDNRMRNLGKRPALVLAEELGFQELNRPTTGSYPLMDIARVLGVPYGDVLLYSDWFEKRVIGDDQYALITDTPHETEAAVRLHAALTDHQRQALHVIVNLTRQRRRPAA